MNELNLVLLASKKTVTIEIDPKDLETLKASNYKLCFAKKVSEFYSVVWQSYSEYFVTNLFSWTPQYQIFGSKKFNDGMEVEMRTNIINIGLGEESTLDKAGVLSDPKMGGLDDTTITLKNEFGLIDLCLNQLSTGIDGIQISTPICIIPVVAGVVSMKPVESVLVWFEQNIETSMMFSNTQPSSLKVEINLTNTSSAVRLYKNQTWSIP